MKVFAAIWCIFVSLLVLVAFYVDTRTYRACNEVYHYADTNIQSPKEIPLENFLPWGGGEKFSEGKATWMRMELCNGSDSWQEPIVLFTGSNEMLHSIEAFYDDGNEIKNLGLCEARLSSPSCRQPALQYSFEIPKGTTYGGKKHIYLKMLGHSPVQNEFYLMPRSYFNKVQVFLSYFIGFSTGISLIVGGLAFLSFLSIRHKSFLYFSLFAASTFFSTFIFRGMWDIYKPSDDWIHADLLFLPVFYLVRTLEVLFIKEFLELRTKGGRFVNDIMNLLIGLCALRFVASIFPPAQQLLWANLGKDILISNLVIFSLLIYLSFKKVAYARAFTMAWSFSIFSLAILGTLKLGWLEHTWVLGFAPLLTRPLQFFALTHLVFEKLKQLLHDYTLAQLEAKQFKLTRQLLRSVSHDLSNTTNSMDFISEFALTKTGDQAVMQRSLSDINKAAKIQSQIIKTAKDLAKSKDQPLKLTEVGLRESIRESLLVLDSKIKNKNLKIIVDSPAELFVLADKTCLTYQVVANLLDNAVKFTPAGKNIYVRLFTNIENEVVLEIEDEGIGIPEKLKSEIFKSSVKVSRKGTEGEESTGLGLLIVHDYIEMFGGSVGFESRELGGTKFTVKFKPADVSVAL